MRSVVHLILNKQTGSIFLTIYSALDAPLVASTFLVDFSTSSHRRMLEC